MFWAGNYAGLAQLEMTAPKPQNSPRLALSEMVRGAPCRSYAQLRAGVREGPETAVKDCCQPL